MPLTHRARGSDPACAKHQPRPTERKTRRFDFKQVNEEGAFEGYASIFGAEDLGRDIVEPGAFAKSLRARGPRGIKMLFQHDPNEPIGVWQTVREDARGLYVAGHLLPDIARAREVLALMRAGALDGLSIGFHTVKSRAEAKSGARHLLEVDLWEISVVTFPMLPEARVRSVKRGRHDLPTERKLERWLTRDAGFSRMEARTIIGVGYKALLSRRDAGESADQDAAALIREIRRATQIFTDQR